ncbi:MAG: YmdB family metallophosphoesterase, partial [Candidatus Omnitrophica bacterium]|nr:YmdB family metallophosphoesterase [Candidatus Omnitrophota bacterium]
VIANAENIAGGSGLTPETVDEALNSQVDVLTSGDHIWKKRNIYDRLDSDHRILRPANYPETCPGTGGTVIKSSAGRMVGVVNVEGRVFIDHAGNCPFRTAEREIERLSKDTNIIFVDIHAEATSEKIALGRFLDGRVSAVFGTHTHVQTADEKILPGKSAYITDLGMTGAQDSVIGRKVEPIVEHFLTCMPTKFEMADKDVELQGAIVEVDEKSGKAVSIERVREKLKDYL